MLLVFDKIVVLILLEFAFLFVYKVDPSDERNVNENKYDGKRYYLFFENMFKC